MNPFNSTHILFSITLLISSLLVSGCSDSGDPPGGMTGGNDTVDPVQASLELVADKTFRISWQPSDGAQFYRVLENPDGVSGFTQISDDLEASTQRFDQRVALYSRINASYIIQACNARGCVDSDEQRVVGTLERAIGYIKASNTDIEDFSGGDQFGEAVSLSADGNTLAVGATYEDSAATGIDGNQNDKSAFSSGAVYVFVHREGSWQQQAYLKASNTDNWDRFGGAVSLSADGNTLAVGAPYEDSAATGINGNQNDNAAEDAGTVYVFVHSNGNWQQQAYVKASNADGGDGFGQTVSLSSDGDFLAIGAPGEGSAATGINGNQDDNSASRSGAVYLFARSNQNWQQHAYVKASNTEGTDSVDLFGDEFGAAISLSADGNTLAVGARFEDSTATGINGDQNDLPFIEFPAPEGYVSGAVYVFARSNGDWQQQVYLKASNTDGGDRFGWAVNLSADGNTLGIGALGEDSAGTGIDADQSDNSATYPGAAYVFVRDIGNWQQQAYLKASNTDATDQFGAAISLSADGNSLAIGALGESSAARGINGNETDDSEYHTSDAAAGAVYMFIRDNGSWQQQAYVKASNTGPGDEVCVTELPPDEGFPSSSINSGDAFGAAVSLSADGDTLAVGARYECSDATGINGNQDDNSANRAGAVYLY